MTLEELDENEDEFGEEDEAAIEVYRWGEIIQCRVLSSEPYALVQNAPKLIEDFGF